MERKPYVPEIWEDVDCLFCGSSDKKHYHKYGNELQFTYVLCKNCKLVYQSPRPKYDEAFIEAAYGQYFLFEPDYEYTGKELKQFNEELNEICKHDTEKTSILDVGSAMGAFLKAAEGYYSKRTGIDASEVMVKFVKQKLNIPVFCEMYDELDIQEKFSCIHMSHVIEHIPNPVEWLKKSEELLTKNGVLVIAVPNMFSLSRRVKLFFQRIGLRSGEWKENWRTPDHLFEPTIPSMVRLFSENNFKVLDYYSYSRKNMTSKGIISALINRKFYLGSNLRFYVQKLHPK